MPWLLESLVALAAALAPDPSDLWHFPPASACKQQLAIASERLTYLQAAQGFYPHDAYAFSLEIARVEAALWAWSCLWSAHDPERTREQLRELRGLIGERDYYEGTMPRVY